MSAPNDSADDQQMRSYVLPVQLILLPADSRSRFFLTALAVSKPLQLVSTDHHQIRENKVANGAVQIFVLIILILLNRLLVV